MNVLDAEVISINSDPKFEAKWNTWRVEVTYECCGHTSTTTLIGDEEYIKSIKIGSWIHV